MSDREQDEHDQHGDPLRAQLAGIDPAASLPSADPAGVTRLLEEIMNDYHVTESRSDRLATRSPLTWLVAAAAVLVIAGVLAVALRGNADDGPGSATVQEPAASPSTSASGPAATDATTGATTGAAASVTELTASPGPAARCMSPAASPQVVAAQTTVFDGTVESVAGDLVTLRPTRFYAGDETDLVTVRAPDDDMQALLAGVDFEEGGRYLVAATDGQVTLCGFSAPYSAALEKVYQEAFAS